MPAIILLVLAGIAFLAAAIGEPLLRQPPADLVAWGLFFWVVAILLGQPIIAGRLNRE